MANKNRNLLKFQGTGAQAGMLGGYAVQQALASGLSKQDIRKAAQQQGLTINPKGQELLAASKQKGKGIQLSQFQGSDAQSNVLGGYAVQQALARGISRGQLKDLAKAQGYKFNQKGSEVLQESSGGIMRTATNDQVITKKELQDIVSKYDGNIAKALNRISTVQQSKKESGKKVPSLASGAANMLIKQAAAPQQRYSQNPILGNSKLGQMLQQMAGSPGSAGTWIKGHLTGQKSAVPMQLMDGGMVLRPNGKIAVRPQQPTVVNQPFDTSSLDKQIASLTNQVNTLSGQIGGGDTTLGGGDTTLGGGGIDIISLLNSLINQPIGRPQFQGYDNLGYNGYGDSFGGGGAQNMIGGGFDMTPLTNMFANQPVLQSDADMEQVMQEIDITDPIQLAALGRSYATNIQGSPRAGKARAMYRRNDMGIQTTPTARKIAGGVTL